jgi:glycosyltransferase involved in cell wall biosynthesis
MRFFHFALLFAYRLRNIRVDHIHAHFISVPADVAMIMARMMNVQYTISAHAHDIIFGKHIPQKIAGCSALLVCHTSGKQRIVNNYCSNPVEAEKIHLVYHGVNNNFWKRQARAGETKQSFLKLLSVGRLVEKKGHKYLLEAVRRMAHKKIPLRCTIIGDGPLKSSFERFITAHQLKAHVFLAGGMCQNEVKNLLEDTDIFVLPCVTSENGDEDGIPNAILEAMAMEVPVISTAVGSIREVVLHNQTGMVVPEKDPEAIISAIEEIFQSHNLSNKLAKNGRALIVDRFDPQLAVDKVQHLFQLIED